MNEKNQDQRIAELETTISGLKTWLTALTFGLFKSADSHKATSDAVLKNMLAMQGANESAFGVLSYAIPDEEIRAKFRQALAMSDFKRDQLEAMLQTIENQPPPSAALAAFVASQPPPPDSPSGSPVPPSSAPPGAP